MNKKLFSWKALAGLALLVAMGMTSCKNTTEVDPNDPYNIKTPTKPGVVSGSADLNINATVPSDVIAQFNSWWGGLNNDQKKVYTDKSQFTVFIKSSMKLDGSKLTVPNIWSDAKGKIVNIICNGGFTDADKKPLDIAANGPVGALVTFAFPGGAFDVNMDAAQVMTQFSSEAGATINNLTGTVGSGNNKLTLGTGATVAAWDAAGEAAVNGGSITALVVRGTDPNCQKNKQPKAGGVEVRNIVVASNTTITMPSDGGSSLDKITVRGGAKATLVNNEKNSAGARFEFFVSTIEGVKDKGSVVSFNGAADGLKNVTSMSNIEISNGAAVNIGKNIFDNVKVSDPATVTASVSNVNFASTLTTEFKAVDTTIAFAGCTFSSAMTPKNSVPEKEIGLTTKTVYQWNAKTSLWEEVDVANGKTVDAAILAQDATGVEVSADDVTVTAGSITKGADKVGSHKWFTLVKVWKTAQNPNAIIGFDTKCKNAAGKVVDNANIGTAIDFTGLTPNTVWFKVKFGDVLCKMAQSGTTWIAVPEQ